MLRGAVLLRGLGNKERGESIKAQVLRQSNTPYQVGVDVLVTSDVQAYRAKIIRVRQAFGQTYVDVEYDHTERVTTTPLKNGWNSPD